jgi:hypothetical protein
MAYRSCRVWGSLPEVDRMAVPGGLRAKRCSGVRNLIRNIPALLGQMVEFVAVRAKPHCL